MQTQTIAIVVLIIAITIRAAEQLKCLPSEELDNCPVACSSDHCPKRPGEDKKCPKPNVCGNPECKCRFNMRRAENGTCIRTQDCPPFSCGESNTEYVSCPSYCPGDDCSQATPDGRCPIFGTMLIVVECVPACRCIKGYWKHNGNCVPYNECPQVKKRG